MSGQADALKGKSVLITGAAGCIGAWVIKELLEIGAQPVAFDLSSSTARLDLVSESSYGLNWVQGDITDYDQVLSVIQDYDIYAVIHLAALQVPFAKADPIKGTQVNVLGTTHIFEACRQAGVNRIAYASSIAAPAMGDNDHLDTLYGAHKVCNEQMAKVYWQDWQVPSICIRPGVIYGPGRDQGMSAAPTIAMLAAVSGLNYTIPFSGQVAFVHVRDAALRFIGAVSEPANDALVFDMQGTPASVTEVCKIIKTQVPGAGITISGSPLPFPSDTDDGGLDNYLGLGGYLSIEQGIEDTIEVFTGLAQNGKISIEKVEELIKRNS